MNWISRIFRRNTLGLESQGIGDIYVFKTDPYTEFSKPDTNRYGAFKVIGYMNDCISVVALNAVSIGRPPELKKILAAEIIIEKRFYFADRPELAVCNIHTKGDFQELNETTFIANAALTSAETKCLSLRNSYAGCFWINNAVEGEWRWQNDRDKVVAESALRDAKEKKLRKAEEIRMKTRLKELTWAQLLLENHFATWELPPKQFTSDCMQLFEETIRTFQLLPPQSKKKDVRKILFELVRTLNELDEKYGGVIETVEREDIMMLIEEMAFLAKHRSLISEVDDVREW